MDSLHLLCLQTTGVYFSSSRGRTPEISAPADSGSGKGPVPGSDPLLPSGSALGGRDRSSRGSLMCTSLTHGGSAFGTSSPPKASPPNTITVAIRFQHTDLGGAQNSDHSRAPRAGQSSLRLVLQVAQPVGLGVALHGTSFLCRWQDGGASPRWGKKV